MGWILVGFFLGIIVCIVYASLCVAIEIYKEEEEYYNKIFHYPIKRGM